MREIKFKIFDMTEKIMCTVYRLEWTDGKLWADCIPHLKNATRRVLDAAKNPLLQYTGLLDRHGKEIWEGDRVKLWIEEKFFAGEVEGVIDWSDSQVMIQYEKGSQLITELDLNFAEIKVIGNIYETPELTP